MRINDRIIDNAQISIVSDKKIQAANGLKRVTLFEAKVARGKKFLTKQSHNLSELLEWISDCKSLSNAKPLPKTSALPGGWAEERVNSFSTSRSTN